MQNPLLDNSNASTLSQSPTMCATTWYKGLNLEFNAFGVNEFGKVMFLMDAYYAKIVQDGFYKCVFVAA
ncbi:unnamed protein product, partial [Rotaria sp. Silwood1]